MDENNNKLYDENELYDNSFYNDILVLGNGFDLALGYRTRYADFGEFVKKYKNNINYKNNAYYKRFDEIVTKNRFISFFSDKDYFRWCDVEEQIHKIANSLKTVFNKKENSYEYKRIDFFNQGPVISVKMSPYDKKVLTNFNLVKINGTKNYIVKNYVNKIHGIEWDKLDTFLKKELDEFKEAFVIYLREFVPLIFLEDDLQKSDNDTAIREKNIGFFKTIMPNCIITFNYTDYWKEIYSIKKIHYVHGDLTSNKIVLGYEDNKLEDQEFQYLKKYIQIREYDIRPLFTTNKMFNEEDPFLDGLGLDSKKDNVIRFYGMSFGITDSDYVKLLFNLDNNKKIIIYCRDKSERMTKYLNLEKILTKEKLRELEENNKILFQSI